MAEVVGLSTRKHQDWFDEADEEIQELLENLMIKLPRLHSRLPAVRSSWDHAE